jgi:ribosomal-protein-alanine N-acetyltransferase
MTARLEMSAGSFVLRPLAREDVTERYLSWMRDPSVTRTLMAHRQEQSLDSIAAYVARHDNVRGYLFGVFAPGIGHIGNFSLWHYPEDERATIGVMVGEKAFWGKDVVLPCRARLLDFIFDDLGCQKVAAGCLSNNAAAVFNFRKQGWVHEGTRRRQYRFDGQFRDELFFAMFAEDWRTRR